MGSILNMWGLRIFGPKWRGVHDTQSQPQHDCGQTSSSHPSPALSHREIESSTDHDMPQAKKAKKVRGETRLKELWNFPPGTPKIIVNFNENDQGIGRGSQQLSQFLGTIVRRRCQLSLRYKNWGEIPQIKINNALNLVKVRFEYPQCGEKWILEVLNDKWRAFKCQLKRLHFDPMESVRDLKVKEIKNVDKVDWAFLVDYWLSDESRAIEERNKNNRANLTLPHTSGSTSFATRRHEETTNNGVPPSRARMFIMTHQRKDGTASNAEAADVINQLEELESQLPEGSQANATRHVVLSQVLGPDTHGRVRTMGLGVTPSRLWPSEKARQQKTENEELRKTVAELKENAKKQDMRFNQLVGYLGSFLENNEEFQSLIRGFQAESQPQLQP